MENDNNMGKVITIAIEKGGSGKTVTASNLAYLMGDEGKRVLCIDTDPQGNLTYALSGGNTITSGTYTGKALYDLFDGFRYTHTKDYIVETEYENVDMIPASAQTPRINKRLLDLFEDAQQFEDGNPKKLASMGDFMLYFVNQVRDEYDYIIIDTQPTRDSQVLSNAIAAADYVLIPMQCDSFSEDSAFRTYTICNKLRKDPASRLKGIGVVLTMVDKGAATRETREECQAELGSALFTAEIPMAMAVKSSVRKCVPVCYSARTQPVGKSYAALYEELKERLEKMEEN